jgi:hypothetical protein
MLPGFEVITYELTVKEMEILPRIVSSLEKRTKQNPITNQEIVIALRTNCNFKTSYPRVRKIINYIRIKGLLTNLVGDTTGYYCTTDPEELSRWVTSMKHRAAAILASIVHTKIPGKLKPTLFTKEDEDPFIFPDVERLFKS